jgi:hypothetical protein
MPASPPVATSSPGPLDGTWTATFTGTDPAEIAQVTGDQIPIGTWTLEFDGEYAVGRNPSGNHGPGEVRVVFVGDTITFPPDPACPGQGVTPSAGRYAYTLTSSTLILKELTPPDTCTDRVATLTAHPWLRSGG